MSKHSYDEAAMKHATEIVVAYLATGSISPVDLPALIVNVRVALGDETVSGALPESGSIKKAPPVPLDETITPHHIICLEDGLHFKSLKRHLKARHNMTPDDYRRKWGLPEDYPMVAPTYSSVRSRLARETGLNSGAGRRPARAATG